MPRQHDNDKMMARPTTSTMNRTSIIVTRFVTLFLLMAAVGVEGQTIAPSTEVNDAPAAPAVSPVGGTPAPTAATSGAGAPTVVGSSPPVAAPTGGTAAGSMPPTTAGSAPPATGGAGPGGARGNRPTLAPTQADSGSVEGGVPTTEDILTEVPTPSLDGGVVTTAPSAPGPAPTAPTPSTPGGPSFQTPTAPTPSTPTTGSGQTPTGTSGSSVAPTFLWQVQRANPTEPPVTYVPPNDDILNKEEDSSSSDTGSEDDEDDESSEGLGGLEQDLENFENDKNAQIAIIVSSVLGFFILLIVAQQLIDHPEGCCMKFCRCILSVIRVICWPCRAACGCTGSRARDRRTHDIMVNDPDTYAYGTDLELS